MTYRVFLSSTAADLDEWRTAVHRALDQMDGVEVVWMKNWVAHDATSMTVCEDKVRSSNIFVGLIGHCFGSAPDAQPDRSYTMLEFDWAIDADLSRLMHCAPDTFEVPAKLIEDDRKRRLQADFRDEISGWHTGQPDSWINPDRLAGDVAEAVRQQIVRMQAARQQGFTPEKHEVRLLDRLNELALAIAVAPADQRATLLQERAAVEGKLRDLETSFTAAQARIKELEETLAREGNHLGAERLARAEAALAEGDFDAADALLAEIEADADLAVQRAARAAYGRGQIAEEQVRWHDAAQHYSKAARLVPDLKNLEKAGTFLWRAGRSNDAIRFAEDALALAQDRHGARSAEAARAMNNLAESHRALGRYAEAEPLYRQAIEIGKATIGARHPAYATRLNNLAGLLRDMGRLAEAEPLYRQAIEIDKATIGERHPGHAIHLNNLASLLRAMGRLAEAEPLYARAIEIGKATIGARHPDYATRLNNLASLLQDMGRFEEAESLVRQAIDIDKTTLGERHPQYATYLNNLASLLRGMRRLEEAEPLFRQAMDIAKSTLGERHPDYATHLNNLAGLLQEMGRLEEAEPLYRQPPTSTRPRLARGIRTMPPTSTISRCCCRRWGGSTTQSRSGNKCTTFTWTDWGWTIRIHGEAPRTTRVSSATIPPTTRRWPICRRRSARISARSPADPARGAASPWKPGARSGTSAPDARR